MNKLAKNISTIIITCLYAQHLFAAGFQLIEANVRNIGDLGAGGGANLDNPTAAYFNPAALSNLTGKQLSVASALISRKMQINGNASVRSQIAETTIYDADNISLDLSNQDVIPAFFYGQPLSNRVAVGFGLSVPFGLATDFPVDSKVRYSAYKSKILALSFTPAISYKLTKHIILGAGLDMQWLDANIDGVILSPQQATSSPSDSKDIISVNNASGIGLGWDIGALFKLATADFAINYHSNVSHNVTGKSTFKKHSLLAPVGDITSTLSSSVTLPGTLSANLNWHVLDKIDLLFGAYFTKWSTIQKLVLHNVASPTGPTSNTLDLGFTDTSKFALGTNIHFSNGRKLMLAIGYDKTPTSDQTRSLRLPDNNRLGFAFGFNKVVSKSFSFDVGYSYLLIDTAGVNETHSSSAQTASFNGKVMSAVHISGIQINYHL